MSTNPTHNPLWAELNIQAQAIEKTPINDLFSQDKTRFDSMSLQLGDLFFDYPKHHITSDILNNLTRLAHEQGVEQARQDMFDGKTINSTEGRSVLHTALRRPASDHVLVNDENIMPLIHQTLERIKTLAERIKNRDYLGTTGKPIDTIISIGIGGSDLGPRMVYQALSNKESDIIAPCHFVSNIDGDDITNVINKCNPETTLIIVISKTFTTQETLTNAKIAKSWLKDKLSKHDNVMERHFMAVSANQENVAQFGIVKDNFFPMWEWVNGRFSLWSAVGLPLALSLGYKAFEALLSGAYEVDQHFQNASLDKNIPVLMAILGIWNRNFMGTSHHAILPYAQRLEYFPAYLQQLEMESNGKDIDLDQNPITDYKTGAVLFGEVGTNGQHSFYQLLHQGSDIIPCDFIAAIKPDNDLDNSHNLLLSHMLAQGQAMMQGRQDNNAHEPYRFFHGNRPSSTLLMQELNAHTLGMLIALYEHKTFTQGIIWNINSFDQYGVELGKELSSKLSNNDLSNVDNSTKGLFSIIHKGLK